MAKWALLLNQYEIIYIQAKAVKGQALADFLADHPIPADWEISDELPDEEVFNTEVLPAWQMFFDGSSRADGAGASVVFISPYRQILPYAFTLGELCSNNVAEYQALIVGLQTAAEMKISNLEVYGDSKLVVDQLLTVYEVKKEDLVPYFRLATQLLKGFDVVTLTHVPRKENQTAEALANLAATLALSEDEIIHLPICQRWVVPTISELWHEYSNVVSVYEIDVDDWRYPLIDYLERNKLSDDPKQRLDIRRRVSRFFYYKETLYRRSFDGLLLRCLGKEEAAKAMEEAHSGIAWSMHKGVRLASFMQTSSINHQSHCIQRLLPTPFDVWGLDAVGPITPKSSASHSYILAATDSFSKWAEAVPLKEIKKENVVDFIKGNIIQRYGVPRCIITDNAKYFSNSAMEKLCEKYHFKLHFSSMYNAPANGLAEAFNKTLCNILKKVVSKTKRDWHERMGEALWAYRTTYRTPTKATPYSLVYGVEAVLPLEKQIPSLRIALQEGLTDEENVKLRLQELEALDEKRLDAQQHLECYQARMSRAFNKGVRPRSFQVGDLVLAVRRPIIMTHKTGPKFQSKWDGPYVVREVYTNGAYKIVAEDGLRIGPINGKFLKRYYA
ncbi:uncharacterized protein LOC112199214 [Rosa chinensis]|uniref:uncharacterized protein LOC112199214 n=1 Tax=Rosa chinensis TaxID=74649 RepID=UPI000D094CE3|nr:uncharacterized protein LOC112199214 [Rosa chinensis]